MAFCACTDETITYVYPEKPGIQTSDPAISLASSDTRYTAVDGQHGEALFRSRGGEVVLRVTTNQDSWTFDTPQADWLTVAMNELDELRLTATTNTTTEIRSVTVTLRTGSEENRATATVSVSQNALGTLEIEASQNDVDLPACGETSVELDISCDADEWAFDCPCSWILVEKVADDRLRISVDDNSAIEAREMDVKLIAGYGDNSASETILIRQQAAAYIVPSPAALSYGAQGGPKTVTIESNYAWDYDCKDEWLSVTRKDNMLTIVASEYASEQNREGTVTITAGDGKQNVTALSIAAGQLGQGVGQMILVYEVPADATRITLPLAGTVACTVNWGDTSVETVTGAAPAHTYEFAGEYIVTIDGTVTGLTSNALKYLTRVEQWGQTGLTSMEKAFYNCKSLTSVPGDPNGSFSDVTTFAYAFFGTLITEIPAGFFDAATKATMFNRIFQSGSIASVPEGLFDHNTAATTFEMMFYGCAGIEDIPAGLFDNCRETTNLAQTFAQTGVRAIPAGLLDNLTKLTNVSGIFSSAKNVAEIPAGLFDNCPEITTFNGAFRNTAITTVPVALFANNTKASNLGNLFYGCTQLVTVPGGLFAPFVDSATSFDSVFYGCTALEEVPDQLFSGFTKCGAFGSLFRECASLKTVPEDLFLNTANAGGALTFNNVFKGCTALETIPSGLFASVAATKFESTFEASGLKTIPAGLFDNASAVTSFSKVFKDCKSLASVPARLFASAVNNTTFAYVFDGCVSLTSVSGNLFAGCTGVKTATYMFNKCAALETVPDGLFDSFTAVTSYDYAFQSCTSLSGVPAGLFDTSKAVTSVKYLFNGCTELAGESPYVVIDGAKYHLYDRPVSDYKSVTSKTACFRNCKKMTDYDTMPSAWR